VAAFTASPVLGNVPLTVAFTDLSAPGSKPITEWAWDFGDSGVSDQGNPIHLYVTPGNYTVSLTVTTAVGTDTRLVPEYISVFGGQEGETEGEGEGESQPEGGTEGEGEFFEGSPEEGAGEGEGEAEEEGLFEGVTDGEVIEGGGEGGEDGEGGEGINEGEGEGSEGESESEGEGGLKEVFVDEANNSDLEDGSWEHPFNTIAEAVASGCSGGIIRVFPGIYHEHVVLKPEMTLCSLYGAYHTHLVSPGEALGPLLTLDNGSMVHGFCISDYSGTGVRALSFATATVTNCVLSRLGTGMEADAKASLAVINNTFYENVIGIRGNAGAVFSNWRNNIFCQNDMAVVADAGSMTGNGFNDYFLNGHDVEGPALLAEDISVDPRFVAPEENNFHLTVHSLCRNAGDPGSDCLDLDGSRNDMGADGGADGVQDLLAPFVRASVTPVSGASPLTVTLDGSASSDEWGIASYFWDVDSRDGLEAGFEEAVVQFQYTQSNAYIATLVVMDNNGFPSQAEVQVLVDPERLPVAAATCDPIGGPVPLTVNFHAEGSNPEGGSVRFDWDFGDSTSGMGQDISHVYEGVLPGNYPALLTVTNELGASVSVSVPVTVTEGPILAAETVFPESGGKVTVSDHPESPLNGASVEISAEGMSAPLALTLCEAVGIPAGQQGKLGNVFATLGIGPSGVTLSQPAIVTIPLAAPLTPGQNAGAVFYDVTNGAWKTEGILNVRYIEEPAPCIQFETTHFSFFSVGTLWTIQSLGTLGGTISYAFGINDAGEVAGYSYPLVSRNWRWAYKWDSTLGMQALGTMGGRHSYAFAINGSGTVVGCAQLTEEWLRERLAFVWDATDEMRDIGNLGGDSTVAQAINTSGNIAGYGTNSSGKYRAFFAEWDGNQYVMTTLPTLGGDEAYAYGINDADVVVGNATLASGKYHAFRWDATNGMTDLGVLGSGTQSNARSINSSEEVVGESETGTAVHAFRWDVTNGMVDLGTLGGTDSMAYAINSDGNIVGTSQIASGDWHAFGWDKGELVDLNDLLPAGSGWVVNDAWSINRSGQVAGRGNKQAFLMSK